MIRALLGVFGGLALAMTMVFVLEGIGHQMYPPPADLDPTDREAFAAAVAAMRYPPVGERSSGTGRAVLMDPGYKSEANDSILVIPQIEDMEGVNNAEAIMALDGVDVAFIGPNDLGLSMGLTSDQMWKDQGHLDAIAAILAAARKVGKPAGVPVGSGEAARAVIAQGFQFIDAGSDLRQLQLAAAERLKIALS